jgi:hypothetical protein
MFRINDEASTQNTLKKEAASFSKLCVPVYIPHDISERTGIFNRALDGSLLWKY